MKKLLLIAALCLPSFAFATWQMAGGPKPIASGKPEKELNNIPLSYRINPRYTLHTRKGRLIHTIHFYLHHHGWKLKWNVSKNLPLLTNATFTGHGVPSVLDSLFEYYPNLSISYDVKHKIVTVNNKNN